MTVVSFEKFINELIKAIDDTNTIVIDNITDPNMKYEWSCIKPNLTFTKYFYILKPKWDRVIDRLVKQVDECETVSKLIFLLKLTNYPISPQILDTVQKLKSIDPNNLKSILDEAMGPSGAP